MPRIKVAGRSINVDIREEVMEYDWDNAKETSEKLVASSPFREDSSPSFVVTFEGEYAGVFYDSAWEEEYWKSGTLPKLLSFLRNESYEESCEYLLEKYDIEYSGETINLMKPSLFDVEEQTSPTIPDNIKLDDDYLPSRGIHPKIIEMNDVRDVGDAVAMPWRDHRGRVSNIKYRHKRSKKFWYADGGVPLSKLVYGLDKVFERGIKKAFIVESEVDAMTIQSAGVYAVAIGGARFNDTQADLIISSGLTEIIVGGDNDSAGKKFNTQVEKLLKGKVDLKFIDYTTFYGEKDFNDLGVKRIRGLKVFKKEVSIRV